jgi:hypothetical protein
MKEKVDWSEAKTDQILLPVMAEMRRRSKSVKQSSIQAFFPQTGSFEQSHGSKRVQEIIKDWN